MKNTLLYQLLILTLIIGSSCKTINLFETPNNMDNVKSTLYLKDGRTISGFLSINTENKKNSKISIQPTPNHRPEKFKLKNVKGYSIGSEFFLLKEIVNNTIVIEKGNSLLAQLLTKKEYYFMARLTAENSRIHLFKNDYINSVNEKSNTEGKKITDYYIQMPNDSTNKVYAINDKLLLNFETKMSALVNDCPTLAQKITDRQPGYFISLPGLPILNQTAIIKQSGSSSMNLNLSKDNNVSILLNIINEYNQCK